MQFDQKKWLEENDNSGIWKAFDEICQIPHCSGNEAELRDFIIKIAQQNNHEFKVDSAGNLLVILLSNNPEIKGTTIIQSHLDMVCEKNLETDFDFQTQAIPWIVKDDQLLSEKTTLGADNGIGIAIAMVLMRDPSISHGNLELLFTIEEETGLTGAAELESNWLKGTSMLNLDSEEEGKICIGCAGGLEQILTIPVETQVIDQGTFVYFKIKNAKGGHSGVNINDNRVNPLVLSARILNEVFKENELRIVSIEGGSRRNAIARECSYLLSVEGDEQALFEKLKQVFSHIFTNELKNTEPDLELFLEKQVQQSEVKALTTASTQKVVDAMLAVPHGVIRMSPDMDNLVETSSNFAIIHANESECKLHFLHRSSVDTGMGLCASRIKAIARQMGASEETFGYYPGWQPDPNSQLLKTAQESFNSIYGNTPEVIAMHAGLECGIIGKKYPGMEMISIGPDIFFPHAPGESVGVSSVERFWKFLRQLLNQI